MSSQELTPVTVLELELDRCGNKYGAAPCTAGVEVNTGTTQAGATLTTAVLAAGASAVDDTYNGRAMTLADARRAIILDYVGLTRTATLDRPWPTNLRLRSEELDNAAWIKTGATVVANAIKAPNGTLSGDKLEETAATSDHRVHQSHAFTIGLPYTTSCSFKAAERNFAVIDFPDGAFPAGTGVFIDLTTGAITLESPAFAKVTVEDQGGGWFRVSATQTATATTGGAVTLIGASSNGLLRSYAGTPGSGIYVWGAQLEQAAFAGAYIETAAPAVDLPDGVVYRVIEAGAECYNTLRSCQDTPNFLRETKTLRFADRGARPPLGQEIRPTIKRKSFAATEINIEKGLAPRASVTLTLQDEAAPDVGADPYIATRPAPAGGTYWTRLLARNHNYSGRPARIRRAYLTGPWADFADFVNELYIIDSISRPDGSGAVQVKLKDPIKLTDRRQIPEPSSGKLAVALTATDLSLTLGPGQGAEYPAPGFVRVGKEVISFTGEAADVLSWPDLTHRGAFGTEAKAASIGGAVQLCRVWQDVPATTVLQEMLSESGIEAGIIDSAGFAKEEIDWLGLLFNVTAVISAPEQVSKLLGELVSLVNGYLWWSPSAQKVKFRVFAPLAPDTVPLLLTDAAHLVEGSTSVKPLDKLRSTVRTLYYDLASATADRGEPASFLRAVVSLDATAESAREYGDRIIKQTFSRWWGAANEVAARTVVNRASGYYRDAPLRIEAKLAGKDAATAEGDQVNLDMNQVAGFDGTPERVRCLVTRRQDRDGQISLVLRTTNFGRRFAFIGPDTIGDYPNDPEFGHIAPDENGFSDGTGPYLIF